MPIGCDTPYMTTFPTEEDWRALERLRRQAEVLRQIAEARGNVVMYRDKNDPEVWFVLIGTRPRP